MKKSLHFLLASVSTLFFFFYIIVPVFASNPPFDSVETFGYENGVSPAPGWYQENAVYDSSTGSQVVGDITNSDGTIAKWTIIDNHYQLHITSHSQLTFVRTFPSSWPLGLNNYEVEYDMYTLNGTNNDRSFTFRHQNVNRHYEVHLYGNMIYLDKANYDTVNHKNIGVVLDSSGYAFSGNTLYHFKITADQNNIKVYINDEMSPILDATDNSDPFLSGIVGFQAGSGSDANGDVWYDNIVITPIVEETPSPTPTLTPTPTATPTITPTPIPTIGVPDLKQYSEPWQDDVYDLANNWSNNPTIKRWGCALTSATMVLNYYNHLIDPGNLNQWLKNQIDGFIGNGLVNWLAISRFSKQNPTRIDTTKDLPILEFQRINNATRSDALSLIDNLTPPILKVPGHFVVGNGKVNGNILINDPASATRITLTEVESAYSGSFTQIDKFAPSHTDLSYIMLVSDPELSFIVYDSNGSEVGESSIEEPITEDHETSSFSGGDNQNINILLLPKPLFGKYTIKTTGGNGKFTISYYAYDQDGNLIENTINKIDIVSSTSQTNSYLINYDSDPKTKALKITIDSTLNDLNVLYSLGWIKNSVVYRNLKSKLMLAKFFTKNPGLYKLTLVSFKYELEGAKRRFLTNDTYQILLRDTNYLLVH